MAGQGTPLCKASHDGELTIVTAVTAALCGSLALVGRPLLAARATSAEWRLQGEIDVFGRVQTDKEGWDVHELVADADVTVLDEHTGVVDRLGQSHEEDLGLQAALEEIFGLEIEHEIKLHLFFLKDAISDETAEQRIAFEQAAGVLLVECEEFSCSFADFGKAVFDAPHLVTQHEWCGGMEPNETV